MYKINHFLTVPALKLYRCASNLLHIDHTAMHFRYGKECMVCHAHLTECMISRALKCRNITEYVSRVMHSFVVT